jgi:hypothetical protein
MAKIKLKKTTAKADTTVIPKPYKVSAQESKAPRPTKESGVPDSTAAKMVYNAKTVATELRKRNEERRMKGKSPISYKSITGSTVIPFSNKGKSFKESPIKK